MDRLNTVRNRTTGKSRNKRTVKKTIWTKNKMIWMNSIWSSMSLTVNRMNANLKNVSLKNVNWSCVRSEPFAYLPFLFQRCTCLFIKSIT